MKNIFKTEQTATLSVAMAISYLVMTLVPTMIVSEAGAVSGAAFTTFNAHVDGATKNVCKNRVINCNVYGDKKYVWLNGGPTANGLGPDGQYFFAVLVPGGQPNPNDGGATNLSDDYDCYQNRTFTVTDGEVSAYGGFACGGSYPFQAKHWLDDGKSGAKPNWKVPYIRLFPYADTENPDGVYILAICSLENGYPVDPRDCKYDAFKVKTSKLPYQFMLSGIKFEDTYANGVKDAATVDPGLPGWTVSITGTGPDGNAINVTATTGEGGYWEWFSPDYTFSGGSQPGPVHLEVCEVLQTDWNQSYPESECYTEDFTPVAGSFDSFVNLDFGNWRPEGITLFSFETGTEGWAAAIFNDAGTVEQSAAFQTDGAYGLQVIATNGGWFGLTFPAPLNLTGMTHLKFDIQTLAAGTSENVAIQFGESWDWCGQSTWGWINSSTTTTVDIDLLDLGCTSPDFSKAQGIYIWFSGGGTFYIDYVRAE